MSLDSITIEIVWSRLREVAASMEHALYHSGYSPILRESHDGTAGLTDALGRQVVIGRGAQFHSIPYYASVQGVLERYGVEGMAEGDSFILNDPYKGGSPHVPDLVAVTPIFFGGRVIAFAVSLAHKPDLGGLVPGSSSGDAREIFHEGLLIPPVKYWTHAGVNEAAEAILKNNSRTPDLVAGDVRGQIGANLIGARKLVTLSREYGVDVVIGTMEDVIGRTIRRIRQALSSWPDGDGIGEVWMDDDGCELGVPVRIQVRAIKQGERLTLDFTGSDSQRRGPVNLRRPIAEATAGLAVLAALDPTIPVNDGIRQAIEFAIPAGSVVDPRPPAPVNRYFPSAHLLYECVLRALGALNPSAAVAPSGLGQGGMGIGYPSGRSGRYDVQYEVMNTSLGGTPGADGAALLQPMFHYTATTPVEILETEYPVRLLRFEPLPDSSGAGQRRGGIGYVREYQFLAHGVCTIRRGNQQCGAWGVNGGKRPEPPRTLLTPGTAREELLGNIATREIRPGDVLRLEMSGGGGYGDPWTREPERVLSDVRNGYVSLEGAERDYGVIVTADLGDARPSGRRG